MERRALVVALALTLPLALYGVPYAYASTQSTYAVVFSGTLASGLQHVFSLKCNTGDYTTNYFVMEPDRLQVNIAQLADSGGAEVASGGQPNGWNFEMTNVGASTINSDVFIVCQSPVTVAGIGVPQFGSLYIAIALGAVLYFILSRRYARRPTTISQPALS